MPSAAKANPVYLVDDDEAVRDSLKLLLESYGFDVRDFASCPEFLDVADGAAQGCLVLDLHLPVMSGLDMLTRYGDRLKGMRVVMMTGRADPTTRRRAMEAGVVAFLEKPFDDGAMVAAVAKAAGE